jgi:transposase-like protein
MAQNKVQYRRGLPMLEFFELYGSHERCEDALRGWRWPEGFSCPRCQVGWHSELRRQGRLYFQCGACRYQCSVLSGTIFESSKLALPNWFLAMHLMTRAKNNISALELKRHLDVSYPTAWLVKHKLMEVMYLREEGRQLTGRIEADDAYLGGERGRGSENKVTIGPLSHKTFSPAATPSSRAGLHRSLAKPAKTQRWQSKPGPSLRQASLSTGTTALCTRKPSFARSSATTRCPSRRCRTVS